MFCSLLWYDEETRERFSVYFLKGNQYITTIEAVEGEKTIKRKRTSQIPATPFL